MQTDPSNTANDADDDVPVVAEIPADKPAKPRELASREIDPESADTEQGDDEADAGLPLDDSGNDDSDVIAEGPLALGRAAIEHAVRHAPT